MFVRPHPASMFRSRAGRQTDPTLRKYLEEHPSGLGSRLDQVLAGHGAAGSARFFVAVRLREAGEPEAQDPVRSLRTETETLYRGSASRFRSVADTSAKQPLWWNVCVTSVSKCSLAMSGVLLQNAP